MKAIKKKYVKPQIFVQDTLFSSEVLADMMKDEHNYLFCAHCECSSHDEY